MPRNQTKRVTIRLTPEEYRTLMWKRIEAAGVTWRDFIFKMCTEGKIVSNDALRDLNKELHYQGNNLNQLCFFAFSRYPAVMPALFCQKRKKHGISDYSTCTT